MAENKYYCQNCGEEISAMDTVCPKCGKNLEEVGRRVLVTVTDTISLSEKVEVIPKEIREKLNPQQLSVYQKFRKAVKDFIDSKEIESITIDIGIVRVVIKGKKGTTK